MKLFLAVATNQDFIEYVGPNVIKNDLVYLFASSGQIGEGHIQVIQSAKTIRTYYIPDVIHGYKQILDNVNEIDAIDVFAPGFTHNIHIVLRTVFK